MGLVFGSAKPQGAKGVGAPPRDGGVGFHKQDGRSRSVPGGAPVAVAIVAGGVARLPGAAYERLSNRLLAPPARRESRSAPATFSSGIAPGSSMRACTAGSGTSRDNNSPNRYFPGH